MTQIISEASQRKLEQHFLFIDQQPAQVCTSTGNTETGSPLYSDGRIWTVTEGNNMPVLAHNGLAADDMVGHWVLVGEHRFSGERHVLAVLTDRNREKGGADFAAHAAAGPTESPDTRLPRIKYDASAAPTVNDDSTGRWTPTSLWGGNSLGALYGLIDNTSAAAVWKRLTDQLALISSLSSATPALNDLYPFADVSDSNNPKQSTLQLVYNAINLLTAETTVAVGDKVAVYDASGSATDSMTLEVLFRVVASFTNVVAALADRLPIADASDSNNAKYVTVNSVLDAHALLTTTAPTLSDLLMLGDASASNAAIKNTVGTVLNTGFVETTSTSTGNIDDLDVGSAPVTVLRMNNASDATIRGIANGVQGHRIIIVSVGAGNVYLHHDDGSSSTAANRLNNSGFVTTLDMPLAAGKGRAVLQYDDTTDRWRLISHAQGAAIAYTPTWTAGTSPTLGDGTLTGSYLIDGADIEASVVLTFGSTTNGGTGTWQFTVPVAASSSANFYAGNALPIDTGVASYPSFSVLISTTAIAANTPGSGYNTATVPFTWGNTDVLRLHIRYRV